MLSPGGEATEWKRGEALQMKNRRSSPQNKKQKLLAWAKTLWNGILEHREKIGPALWAFVWLLDKVTVVKDGKGIVLGGAPVKIKRIARELNRSDRTVRRNLARLEDGKYIERTRTPYGLTIRVRCGEFPP